MPNKKKKAVKLVVGFVVASLALITAIKWHEHPKTKAQKNDDFGQEFEKTWAEDDSI